MTTPDEPARYIPATAEILDGWFGPVVLPGGVVGVVCAQPAPDDTVKRWTCWRPPQAAHQASRVWYRTYTAAAICLDPMRPEVRDHLTRQLDLPAWMRDCTDAEVWGNVARHRTAGSEAMPSTTSPHPFPFRRGMRVTRTLPGGAVEEFTVIRVVTCADGVVRLAWATDTDLEADYANDGTWGYPRADACTPVDCGATRGELLEAVREVWGDPHLLAYFEERHGWEVEVYGPCAPETGLARVAHRFSGPTEFAALLAAYNAAPRSTT